MTLRQSMTVGEERFRVRPWHADPTTAYLALGAEVARPSTQGLEHCLRTVADAGYRSVITSALHPDEAHVFELAHFEEFDRLCVLVHDLSGLAELAERRSATRCRRGRRRDRAAALAVDAAAFPELWQLDATGFSEAVQATPRSRFRVALQRGRVSGYAITGRAGRQAFLQRLATAPELQRTGIGSALVLDALTWSARHRADRLLVNTQRQNGRARSLYERLGFVMTPTELVVLTRALR